MKNYTARLVIWIIFSAFFFKQVLFPLIISNSLHLWTFIKHRKFIHIILNFIIISILISSTSFFTPFLTNTLFLKLQKHSSFPHHHDHHESTRKVASPPDDVWWFFSLSQMDQDPGPLSTAEVEETTASFGVPQVDKHCNNNNYNNNSDNIIVEDNLDVMKPTKGVVSPSRDEDTWWFFSLPEMDHKTSEEEEETSSFRVVDQHHSKVENIAFEEKTVLGEEGEGEEEDGLDATWKAIMESKGKESGPQMKKSDTWTAGDGGGDERRKESGGVMGELSKYRVTVQLKKWHSFRDMIERREYFGGGGDNGGGHGAFGGKRGWQSVDMALTFHDELKKRADAFIARFTHDIRLQRLESEQRFMEMINRGL